MSGVRQFAADHRATIVRIRPVTLPTGEVKGNLFIVFERRYSFECDYGSWVKLKESVRKWRKIHGAKLYVTGILAGKVDFLNPNLV